ncbi:hypothetical protein BHE74_00033850 [Ensete ventricosum]|nr:hypothetical protein BHE74_00033850 [Ensete ventricosum]
MGLEINCHWSRVIPHEAHDQLRGQFRHFVLLRTNPIRSQRDGGGNDNPMVRRRSPLYSDLDPGGNRTWWRWSVTVLLRGPSALLFAAL